MTGAIVTVASAMCSMLCAVPASAQCEPSWQGLGSSSPVRALCVFDDDGDGPRPASTFVGGDFLSFRGITARRVARLTGGECSAVGTNVAGGGFGGGVVRAMVVFDDDGPGPNAPALYVGGSNLITVDGMACSGVAKWDGVAWSSVGSGSGGAAFVNSLCVFDEDGDGPGLPTLIAGGLFSNIGGVTASFVARWDGSAWSALGPGPTASVVSLTAFDEDGSGPGAPALFVGGQSGVVERWAGGSWSAMWLELNGAVNTLIGWDSDGDGPAPASLYMGRTGAIGQAAYRWDGTAWVSVALPLPHEGADDGVHCFSIIDLDGAGGAPPRLVAGLGNGGMNALDDNHATLKWYDGVQWRAVKGWPRASIVHALFGGDAASGGAATPVLLTGGSAPANGTWLAGNSVFRMEAGTSFALSGPADVSASPGDSASFHVGWPASAMSYQWRRGGEAIVDGGNISGAATATLMIDPVSAADAGVYECVVVSGCAGGITRPAALSVSAPDPCPADTNGDGAIDFLDLNWILGLFGQPCPE